MRTVAQKGRIKAGASLAVLYAEPAVVASLGLPADIVQMAPAAAEVVFVFVGSRAELETRLRAAVTDLADGAVLWVFFRKGSRAAGRDMNRNDIWALSDGLGLRPLGLLSVDEEWSAFRLRRGP